MTNNLKAQIIKNIAAAQEDSRQYRTSAAGLAMIESGYALVVSVLNTLEGSHTIAEAQAAMDEMDREGLASLTAEAAQWDLTEMDREYAINIANQDRHWIKVN